MIAIFSKLLHSIVYFFLTPGSHWYCRTVRQIELTLFLLNHFLFDAKTLVQISDQVQKKIKSNFNYLVLLKAFNDISVLNKVIHESKGSWSKNNEIRVLLRKLLKYFGQIIYDQSKQTKQNKLSDFFVDNIKLHSAVNHKDKIWLSSERTLFKIEIYFEKN